MNETEIPEERELTERQRRFVLEYLRNGGNGTEAAIAAGYSPRSAHVQASRMLKDDKVQAYRRACARNMYQTLGLTPEQIGLEVWAVFRRCMQAEEHLRWDPDERAYVPDGTWVFDAKNALRALELLGKQAGAFTEKVEITTQEKPMTLAQMLAAAKGVLADAGGAGDPAPAGAETDQ